MEFNEAITKKVEVLEQRARAIAEGDAPIPGVVIGGLAPHPALGANTQGNTQPRRRS